MVGEKIQHGAQNGGIAKAGAQIIGREAGQCKESFGAGRIGQHPAQRLQGKGCRIGRG